jgi:adenosine kinase
MAKVDCKIELLGMGNPLLDISADVPLDFLEKYGVTLNNAILAEDKHLPMYQEMVDSFKVSYIAGGATQNSIRVAQWMLGKEGLTGFMGGIGKDDFGDRLQRCAESDGVLTNFRIDPETPTGTCGVLVHGGERSLIANLAAANKFTETHLDTDLAKAMVDSARIIYISGFFLTVSPDSIQRVAKQAAEANKVFCMNLSAPFLIDFFAEPMAAAMPYTDYVFANESEAAAYGTKQGWGTDLKTVALNLAAQPKASTTRPRIVVFTQGSECTMVAQDGVVHEFAVDKLDPSLLVDTNGAGDAFVGGFLSQLLQGKELKECVQAGHWASRVIIQRSGCSFPSVCDYGK